MLDQPQSHTRKLLLSVLPALFFSTSLADDWPHWMGPSRDGIWREPNIIREFPEDGLGSVFRRKLGAGYGGPAVANGRLFVMDRTKDEGVGQSAENNIRDKRAIAGGEQILCLDSKTGESLWRYSYDCPYRIAYPTSPRWTPTVDDELVFTLGAMGDLTCLNVATGSVVWQNKLTESYDTQPPLWGYASHPVVDGNHLLVPVGGNESAVVCFEKNTGRQVWASLTTKDIGYAPLVIAEPASSDGQRQLIFWHAAGVSSLDPATGLEFWSSKFPEQASPSVVTISTPVFNGNRLLITDFYAGALVLDVKSDPPSFTEVWRGNGQEDTKAEPANGMMNCMMSTAVVRNGVAWGVAHSRRGRGVMRCIDLKDGKQRWENETWADGKSSLMFANGFLIENGELTFVFNDLGDLIIARINKDGYEEIDRAHILDPTSVARGRAVVWSAPAFANGCMFVRNDKEIVCVDLKQR